MGTVKRLLVYLATLPVDLAGWLLVLLIWLLWGTCLRVDRGVLSCELKPDSFPVTPGTWPRGWYLVNRQAAKRGAERPWPWGGTTVGHAQWYGPGRRADAALLVHEDHHTRQAEAAQMAALGRALAAAGVVAALGHPVAGLWLGAGLWALGGVLSRAAAAWLVAWLRGGHYYRDSVHEVGARGVESHWKDHGGLP